MTSVTSGLHRCAGIRLIREVGFRRRRDGFELNDGPPALTPERTVTASTTRSMWQIGTKKGDSEDLDDNGTQRLVVGGRHRSRLDPARGADPGPLGGSVSARAQPRQRERPQMLSESRPRFPLREES